MKIVEASYLTQSRNDARGVEPRGHVVEMSLVTQDGPEFASQAAFHQKVHELAVLECAVQSETRIDSGVNE